MRRIVTVEPAGSKGVPRTTPSSNPPFHRVLASPRRCGGGKVESADRRA
jgi:hypothetical protein